MFGKSEIAQLLDDRIADALRELKKHDESSEEYLKILDRVVTLNRMKEEDKSRFGSKDNLTAVVGNLLGIFMIVKHEHVNVIVSRAMQLIRMPTPKI
jgi:hypothetical protein